MEEERFVMTAHTPEAMPSGAMAGAPEPLAGEPGGLTSVPSVRANRYIEFLPDMPHDDGAFGSGSGSGGITASAAAAAHANNQGSRDDDDDDDDALIRGSRGKNGPEAAADTSAGADGGNGSDDDPFATAGLHDEEGYGLCAGAAPPAEEDEEACVAAASEDAQRTLGQCPVYLRGGVKLAGLGVAFHAKPKVKKQAKVAVNTLGLDGILYLLGIRDSEALVGTHNST